MKKGRHGTCTANFKRPKVLGILTKIILNTACASRVTQSVFNMINVWFLYSDFLID